MSRDIHYCECGDEIFADMERCSACERATKTERRALSALYSTDWLCGQQSLVEEALAALWCIAALLAWNGGIKWLAVLLFIKAGFDVCCAVGCAIREILAKLRAERREPHNVALCGERKAP